MQASYAAVAMRQLGAAAHVQLLTSPQTANDVISFQFKDVPFSDAMRRIAGAVDGTWKQEGQEYRLIRTSAQQNAEIRKEFDETVASIRKSIQRRVDDLQKMSPWCEDEADALATKVQALIKTFNPKGNNGNWYKKGDQFCTQTPIGRALTKVAAALDPIELASLKQQMKAVWSSNPTATQKPFPSEISSIADEFVKAQADWATAIDKYQLKAPSDRRMTYYVGGLGDFKDNAGGKVSVVLLSVTPQGPKNGFYVELTAFDEKGKKIALASTVLSIGDDGSSVRPTPTAPVSEEKIKLDSDALALIANRNTSPGRGKKLAEGLINKLIRPEQFDPLSIFLSPKLIQAANIKKVNMVAHLSDDMFNPDLYFATKETSVDEFFQKNIGVAATVELKDGWLTVTPIRPAECRALQADRIALGKYLRKLSTGRPLSIDELSAFAISLPDTVDNYMPTSLEGFLRTERFDNYDPNMLRLYGLLTQDQKASMANGGLPFGALGAEELEYVNRMIYKLHTQIGFEPPNGGQARQKQPDLDLFSSDLMREPTECLPTGVPPQGLITLSESNSNVVFASKADPNSDISETSGASWNAHDLGWLKYCQERPDIFPRTKDDFKKQFQDAYDHYAKVYANAKPGQLNGGDSGPPP
jgi:hypothetical protein